MLSFICIISFNQFPQHREQHYYHYSSFMDKETEARVTKLVSNRWNSSSGWLQTHVFALHHAVYTIGNLKGNLNSPQSSQEQPDLKLEASEHSYKQDREFLSLWAL